MKNSEITNEFPREMLSKKDSIVVFTIIIISLCLWSFFVTFCQNFNLSIAKSDMSIIVLGLSAVMCLFIIKFTEINLSEMGLEFKDFKRYLFINVSVSIIIVIIMVCFKLTLIRYFGIKINSGKNFFDFTIFYRFPIMYYPISVFLQEFSVRGVMQESFCRIFNFKNGDMLSTILSSLICGAFHMHMGFVFMISTTVFLFLIGLFYQKQRNIWGCCYLHYVFAISATMLGLL